jgi:hypothetical protein
MKSLLLYNNHESILQIPPDDKLNVCVCENICEVHYAYPYDSQIEYLESDGISYINTGITPTLSYSVEMEFKWISPWSSIDASGSLFGTMQAWNNNTFMFVCTTQTNKYQLFNCWGNKNTSKNNTSYLNGLLNNWHSLVFRNKTSYIDGTAIAGATDGTGTPVGNVYVFCINYNNNSTYGKGTIKQIRKFKLYDGSSNLIMDLIPVRKNKTGYMFDNVTGRLFGNAGKGKFILGPDI